MSFTAPQIESLKAPLDRSVVKERKQAGRKLSYIEGWQVIAEANRIFGFGAWSSETIDIRAVSEAPRKIGEAKRDGFGVSYVARVRVTVTAGEATIVREGVGSGHGIDVDIGLAHESAIKEAETDARKRALMTFGNPFGLALYDKSHSNVVDAPARLAEPATPFDDADGSLNEYMASVRRQIAAGADPGKLIAWWNSADEKQARRDFGLSQQQATDLKNGLMKRIEALSPQREAAQ